MKKYKYKKYKYKIAKYKNYIIECGKSPIDGTIEFWLYNINYGVKDFIFGLNKHEKKMAKSVLNNLLNGEIKFYIQSYKENYED